MKEWRLVINKRYSYSWFKSLYHSSRIVPSKRLRSLHIYIMIQSVQQMWNKIRSINFVGQEILTRVWFAKFDNSLLFLQAFSCIDVYWVVVFAGDGRNRMISCDCFENVKKYASFSRRKFDLMSSYLPLGSPVCNGKVKEGPKNCQRFSWKRKNQDLFL